MKADFTITFDPTLTREQAEKTVKALEEFYIACGGKGFEVVWKEDPALCDECGKPTVWIRRTQFSGDHYFCDEHARKEKNFGKENPSSFFWMRTDGTLYADFVK